MPLNAQFFAAIRSTLYDGSLSQNVVDGCNTLCKAFDDFTGHDHCNDDLAYVLATAHRETGPEFNLSIVEIGKGRGKEYGKPAGPYNLIYYGRGPTQTTWLANYQKEKLRLKYDFVKDPDKLCDPYTGAVAMIDGMYAGLYTGKSLRSYITPGKVTTRQDFINCRRIINGQDHAAEIADVALAFHAALLNGYDKPLTTPLPATAVAQMTPQSQPQRRGLVWEIGRLFGSKS